MPTPKTGSLSARLRDQLVADAGWLTTAELVGWSGAHRSAVWESLKRLHARGAVDRFKVGAHKTLWRATGATVGLDEAKALVSAGTPFGDVYERVVEGDRLAFKGWFVTASGVPNLARAALATAVVRAHAAKSVSTPS